MNDFIKDHCLTWFSFLNNFLSFSAILALNLSASPEFLIRFPSALCWCLSAPGMLNLFWRNGEWSPSGPRLTCTEKGLKSSIKKWSRNLGYLLHRWFLEFIYSLYFIVCKRPCKLCNYSATVFYILWERIIFLPFTSSLYSFISSFFCSWQQSFRKCILCPERNIYRIWC